MSEVQMTPDQIVDAMPAYLITEKAGTPKATIQSDLRGDGGGKWWVKIHDGKAASGKGDPGEPANLTLLADAHDWVKIMSGQMDATAAFMQGKLKIKGDMGLAIKMQTCSGDRARSERKFPGVEPGAHLLLQVEKTGMQVQDHNVVRRQGDPPSVRQAAGFLRVTPGDRRQP